MGLEGGLGPGRELVLLRDEPGEHDRDGRRIQAVLAAIGAHDPIVRAAGKGPDLARLARLTRLQAGDPCGSPQFRYPRHQRRPPASVRQSIARHRKTRVRR